MTIEECYQKLHGDYAQVLQRLPSASLVERFVVKFLGDDSFVNLCKAMEAGKTEDAFRAAHTLKGVSANLGLEQLRSSASQLTELLRGETGPLPVAAEELMEQVRKDYALTAEAIEEFQASRG